MRGEFGTTLMRMPLSPSEWSGSRAAALALGLPPLTTKRSFPAQNRHRNILNLGTMVKISAFQNGVSEQGLKYPQCYREATQPRFTGLS